MQQSQVQSQALQRRFETLKVEKFNLDLTRGKPSDEQVRLSLPIYGMPIADTSTMNYGAIEGVPAARRLFSELLGSAPERTFVSGNASLGIMRNLISEALVRPLPDELFAWNDMRQTIGKKPVMLCPSPGYDRHHNICKHYDIDMIPVPMRETGPDMDVVLRHVMRPEVIGMWCVPIYGNPSGVTYSPEVCRRLARMKTYGPGFRIVWDMAYLVHHLTDTPDTVPDMQALCQEAGHEDRVFTVASTSKMTFPDAGLGILTSSERNMAWYRESVFVDTIGQHKLDQLRHVYLFRDLDGIHRHMRKNRAILEPKLHFVLEWLRRELGGRGIVTWNEPRGGYFVGLTFNGSARRIEKRAAEAGLKLTPAGSCDPLGKDDSFLRLAWTYPSMEELKLAMEVLTLSVLIEAEST